MYNISLFLGQFSSVEYDGDQSLSYIAGFDQYSVPPTYSRSSPLPSYQILPDLQ
jgi:hypothetical protein